MADFYTQTPDVAADWTSSSKGFKGNSVAGDIFQGAGDALKMGVTAADEYYKGTIKEQARSATDELFNASGNAGAVATEGGIKGQATPEEIQHGYNQLSLLKQASQNGTLKESSFWAQAELISRQLKSRYPGYWEHIDGTMSELTGRKPAIALHAELEQERKAHASQDEISRKNALTAARGVGLSEVFVREQQGKPIPTDEINRMVADREGIKWNQEAAARNYALKKQQNEVTTEDALLAQRTDAQTELTTMLKDVSSPLYRNVEEYRAYAQQADALTKSGQPIPPELSSAITSTAGIINQAAADVANKYTLKYAADAPMSKLKDNIDFLTSWAKNYTSNVAQADMNYTARDTAMLEQMQKHDMYNFMNSTDIFRKSHSLMQILGPASMLQWETNNPQIRNSRDIVIQKQMENDHLLEGKPLKDGIVTMYQMGISDPEAYNAHVTRQMNAVTADQTPPIIKGSAIEALYGEGNADFLNVAVPENQRVPVFLKMSSPAMINKVKELYDKGLITTQDYDKHVKWVATNAMQLIRDHSPDINAIGESRRAIKVKYNENTQQLEVAKTDYKPTGNTVLGRVVNEASENYLSGSATRAVNEVNYIIKSLKPLAKATGEDPKVFVASMLSQSGINLDVNPDKEGQTGTEPLVNQIETGIYNYFENLRKNELRGQVFPRPSNTPDSQPKTLADLDALLQDKNVPEEKKSTISRLIKEIEDTFTTLGSIE